MFSVFISLHSYSQSSWDTLPWKAYSDYKLLQLNKSLIPTGILYDRIFPIAEVDNHFVNSNSIDTISPSIMMLIIIR